MFSVPEQYRIVANHPLATNEKIGNYGYFVIDVNFPRKGHAPAKRELHCIASEGYGWEHVSVQVRTSGKSYTPWWNEMNLVKDLFWDEEDAVFQIHPPKTEYVNNHPHVLHLWRPIGAAIPTPPWILVGLKGVEGEL